MKYEDYMEMYKFSDNQIELIETLVDKGASDSIIKAIANPKLSLAQMMALRESYRNGLTEEQIELIADERLEVRQIHRLARAMEDANRREKIIKNVISENEYKDFKLAKREYEIDMRDKEKETTDLEYNMEEDEEWEL